jgi:hypothetical protein
MGNIISTKDVKQALGKVQSNVQDLYNLLNGILIPGRVPTNLSAMDL